MAACQVVVVRHGKQQDLGLNFNSWGLPAVLTPDGVELAKNFVRFHKEHLRGCKLFVTSPLIRAQQTLFEMMKELGFNITEFDSLVRICDCLYTQSPLMYTSADPNETVDSWAVKNLSFAMAEGERIYEAIQCLVVGLMGPEGGTALCVSHGGPVDLLLAYAKNELPGSDGKGFYSIKDLKKGEGIILSFDAVELVDIRELRFPK